VSWGFFVCAAQGGGQRVDHPIHQLDTDPASLNDEADLAAEGDAR